MATCSPTLSHLDPIDELHTLLDLARWRAECRPNDLAYTFLVDGDREEINLTYGELDRRARAIAATLVEQGAVGERALLIYEPGLDYIAAFFGCIYASVIAVPVYPPDPMRLHRMLPRLQAVIRDAQARWILSTSTIRDQVGPFFRQSGENVQCLATDLDMMPGCEEAWVSPNLQGSSLAYLQYTSGSTGLPKGVMVSHANVLHNVQQMHRLDEIDPIGVNWTPPYHDMGLIAGVLLPLYSGGRIVLMSPLAFVQRPARWLEAITRYGATMSGSPNFGYELCVRKISAEERAGLDLSSWTMAGNGAEPVRADTMERFIETFEPCGFSRRACHPAFGLAEATLMVSCGTLFGGATVKDFDAATLEAHGRAVTATDENAPARRLVGCGQSLEDQRVVIVDPKTCLALDDGQIGEIWVTGPSVAGGYWKRPAESEHTFRARLADSQEGPFLRTGDLGFLDDDELFVTGRLKDLIIVAGRNHYPQDIERTIELCDPALKPEGGAAFAVDVHGEERLVVVHEVLRPKKVDLAQLIEKIRMAIVESHDLLPHAIVLISGGSIPKTSSGKIQRRSCREMFLHNELLELKRWQENGANDATTAAMVDEDAPRAGAEQELAALWCEVLGISQVSRHINFFDAGGHSLLATQLISRIRALCQVELPLRALFESPTIAMLAERIEAERKSQVANPQMPMLPARRDRPLPLSFAQQRLWFMSQLNPNSPFYNLPAAVRLEGELDVAALHRSLQEVVRRHESLRTTFPSVDGEPHQIIAEHLELPFECVDLSAMEDRMEQLARQMADDARRGFDLASGPLVRTVLYRLGPCDHVLLLAMHHIVADGWSMGVMVREAGLLYDAFSQGHASPLAELPLQYADFACWQRERLSGEVLENELTYWRKQLADVPQLRLPTDRPRPAIQTFRGSTLAFELPSEVTRRVDELCHQAGATRFMTLLAAFQALLGRYTRQDDIVVGVGIANRQSAEIEPLIGFFVNMLVMRTDLSGEPTFRELLGRVREVALGAYAHQEPPFEQLVAELHPQRDLSCEPLFQVAMVMQNAPFPKQTLANLSLTTWQIDSGTSKFDLTLYIWENDGQLTATLEYNADLFEAATVSRLVDHWLELLAGAVENPELRLKELSLVSAVERQQLLTTWNDTAVAYPHDRCVHELFESQAAATPDHLAVVYGENKLTYRELNERANQVAHLLRSSGVQSEAVVGLCVPRSVDLVVGMLGILKAGAAYLPLDDDCPAQRFDFMLADAAAPVLLTTSTLARNTAAYAGQVIMLDTDADRIAAQPVENLANTTGPLGLAYVIYTSGSTGAPKGVAVVHQGINRLICNASYAQIGPTDRLSQVSNAAFDAFTFEIWGALLQGATMVGLAEDLVLSPTRLAGEIEAQGITVMFLTTALFNEVARLAPHTFRGLRYVIFGGEQCDARWQREVLRHGPPENLLNMYGPTECTTFATGYRVEHVAKDALTLPIGRPIANTVAYVLDERREPVPTAVPGELFLGGPGLARGYLNRPELTAERFIADPFSADPQARLYKTGDLVLQRADGDIEFLGRVDHQVKIRGFRIELGEIEAVLAKHPAVRQAVVLAREDVPGDKRLVAYVAAEGNTPATDNEPSAAGVDHVAHWEHIYDELYRRGAENHNPTFNIVGWNSSYTGQPLPAEEMRQLFDHTLARIRAFQPKHVLEIGCGTGLILLQLAGECRTYCGTDLSGESLRCVESALHTMTPRPTDVTLRQQPANDFSGFEAGTFDLVIINSVVQYFPSIDYLVEVLQGALRVLRPGGKIFLGDLRSRTLLAPLHASMELFRAAPEATRDELLGRMQRAIEQEQELCLDPALFAALPERLEGVTYAESLLKRGRCVNELTKYRYDAVIYTAGGEPGYSETAASDADGGECMPNDVEELRNRLVNDMPTTLVLRGLPNARLHADMRAWQMLTDPTAPAVAQGLREACLCNTTPGLDPEALYALGEELSYEVRLHWSTAGEGCFDAIFSRRGMILAPMMNGVASMAAAPSDTLSTKSNEAASWQEFANDPQAGLLARRLVPELRNLATSALPEYMVPSTFVLLDSFPLNANGKVDRRALPAPAASRPTWSNTYTAPRTQLEAQLAAIWEELLGVRPVGVTDSFFDLGGHSMLALRLMAEVEKLCGRKLPLSVLFEGPTVARLAELIEQPEAPTASLVPLKPQGTRRPFFCVHPGGGTVFCYLELARHLSPDQPLLALQAQGLDGLQAPHTTVEEMAAHYIKAIREQQPQGPYRLGGWSFGGNVAYEMACQLEAEGEAIELLVLLDSGAASADRPPSEEDLTKLLMGLFPAEEQLSMDELKLMPPAAQLAWFVDRAKQAQLVGLAGMGTQSESQVFGVFKSNLQALAEFRCRRYGGKVTLIRASEQALEQGQDPQLGWSSWADGGVEVHEIAGDHVQMLQDPLVRTLANIVQGCLDRVDARQRSSHVIDCREAKRNTNRH
jgi:amino acid adenylation domain-containing protein